MPPDRLISGPIQSPSVQRHTGVALPSIIGVSVFENVGGSSLTQLFSFSLHWLRVAERITFRLAVLTYRCLHRSAPEYLTSLLQCVSGIHTRQRLRSASSSDLMVPRTIRSTIGERPFQSAAASKWNAVSHSVRSSTSVLQFRSRLKTELFARSYQQSY